jgi:hypothetical protein
LRQPNQIEDGFFNSQSPGTGVLTETLDSVLASHPIHQYQNNDNYLHIGFGPAGAANPIDTSNLDESVLQHFPLNQDTLETGNSSYHMDDLHVVNCQAQPEHPNGASSSVVEVESVQRSRPTKSVFGRRSQNKKGRSHFSEAAKRILRCFYSKNPYPEKNDVSDLANRAKLTPKQIRIWFSNKRNRNESSGKQRKSALQQILFLVLIDADIHASNASTTKSPIPKLTRHSLDSLDSIFEQSERKSSSPVSINRYLESALDDDAVAFNVIERAALNSQSSDMDQPSLKVQKTSRASSVLSVTSYGSRETFATCASGHSLLSSASRASRRGRRKLAAPIRRLSPKRHKTAPKLFCTFCGDEFVGKYEWRRHEQTVHMPQKAWVCNCAQLLSPDRDLCPYDLLPSPTDEHLAQYNHFSCIGKPEAERTFFRKDKLVQHLRRTHRMTESALQKLKAEGILDSWEIEPDVLLSDDLALNCGFCGLLLQNWDMRVEHVFEHFLEGKSQDDWWSTRL